MTGPGQEAARARPQDEQLAPPRSEGPPAEQAARREAERREAQRRDAEEARRARERRAAERAEKRRRRRRRRQRPLRDKLLSENLRTALAFLVATASALAVVTALPELSYWNAESREDALPLLLLLLIIIVALYSLIHTGLTYLALSHQPRARLVATARLPRVRRHVTLYRWLYGRSGPAGEVLQLIIMAAIAIALLVIRPQGVPVSALLGMTVAAIVIVWIGSVLTYAVEYIAEDAHGGGFELPGTPAPERMLSDYLYAAVLIQASSGSSEFVPLTTGARRAVRNHVMLAHVTSTIIITLAVSVVITAVA